MLPGTLYVGTSGFAYPAWVPTFYPSGSRSGNFLRLYAERLSACELNNTFYRQPSPAAVAGWVSAVPAGFRFAVKAQRGGTMRTLAGPTPEGLAWLTAPLGGFGGRLGSVLFRIPESVGRDDGCLGDVLAAWPRSLPLTIEAQHPSWQVDETFQALASAGAVLCTTELDADAGPPTLRLTGPFLYLRLRRTVYEPDDLTAWASRLAPFLADGRDVYAFFRHDETGLGPLRAIELAERVRAELGEPRSDPARSPAPAAS